jgi:hypothetical protein
MCVRNSNLGVCKISQTVYQVVSQETLAKIYITPKPQQKIGRILHVCTGFKPLGINVNFRRFLSRKGSTPFKKGNFVYWLRQSKL